MADLPSETDSPDLEEVRARLLVLNMMIDTLFEDAEEGEAMNGVRLLHIVCTPIERRVIWNQLIELDAIVGYGENQAEGGGCCLALEMEGRQ